MRYAAIITSLLLLIAPADAAVTPEIDPRASLNVVQQWIYNYRAKPDYAHVPAAVRVLFHAQTFKEPENSGIYLGFIAGAIGSNPAKAEQLVASLFPVAPEDEWVIVRAIAYSGLPDWRNLLRKVAPKMPGRKVMIDAYLAVRCRRSPTSRWKKPSPACSTSCAAYSRQTRSRRTTNKKLKMVQTFAGNQDLLDTLWGYYFATGSHLPIRGSCRCCPGARAATPSTS